MRLARLLDALFLFGGGQLGFGGAHRGRGLLRRSLGFGHPRPHRLEFAFARGNRGARAGDLGLPAVAVAIRGRDARLDLHGFARDAFELRAHAAAVLAEVLQFLLELRDLGIGGVKGALQAVQQVGLLEMAVAHLFLPALGLAQFRRLRLQQHLRLAHFVGGAVLRGLRLAQPREGEQVVREREIGLQVVVARRDLGLLAEALELAREFAGDVAHARAVVARVLEPQLGLAAALAVFRHARGLLEEHAQLLGARRDDARDHALLDDGVGARAETRAEEDVGHVAAADVLVVQVIAGVAIAGEHALHADLAVLRPRPADAPEAVVEHQLDRRAPHGLAAGRPREDHVLHVLAAQLLRRRFAEHPAHRVDHVGLAATVGADHADQLAGDLDRGRVDEGLESGELDLGEAQWTNAFLRCPGWLPGLVCIRKPHRGGGGRVD